MPALGTRECPVNPGEVLSSRTYILPTGETLKSTRVTPRQPTARYALTATSPSLRSSSTPSGPESRTKS